MKENLCESMQASCTISPLQRHSILQAETLQKSRSQTQQSNTSVFSTHCWIITPLHISFQEETCSSARGSRIWLYRIIQAAKDSPAFCSKQDHLSAQKRLLRALYSWVLKTNKDRNSSTSLGKLFHCWTTCCYRATGTSSTVISHFQKHYRRKTTIYNQLLTAQLMHHTSWSFSFTPSPVYLHSEEQNKHINCVPGS